MDIKKQRYRNDRDIPEAYPGLPDALGSAGNDANMWWFARSSSWQGGANVDYKAIEAEKKENDLRFGVPHEDNVPNPAASNDDTNQTLPNPHNFSNNPGFMGTSTASSAMMAAPRPGTGLQSGVRKPVGARPPSRPVGGSGGRAVGRSPFVKGSVAMPAPGDTDPSSEGTPQVLTTGRSGG